MTNPFSSEPSSIRQALQTAYQDYQPDRPLMPEPSPTGYAASNSIVAAMTDHDAAELYALAEKILQHPDQVRLLGDRVYDLLQNDIRYQRDRLGQSRG